MDKRQFQGICKRILSEYGFEKQNSSYYRDYDRLMILVDVVRSSYSDCYYFDYGYCIKEISRGLPYPKVWELDLRGRLSIGLDENKEHSYEVYQDMVSENTFEPAFRKAIDAVMIPDSTQADSFLKDVVKRKVCNATGWAMDYLGIKDCFNPNDR